MDVSHGNLNIFQLFFEGSWALEIHLCVDQGVPTLGSLGNCWPFSRIIHICIARINGSFHSYLNNHILALFIYLMSTLVGHFECHVRMHVLM